MQREHQSLREAVADHDPVGAGGGPADPGEVRRQHGAQPLLAAAPAVAEGRGRRVSAHLADRPCPVRARERRRARGWPGGSPRRGAVTPARAVARPPPAPRPPSARRGSPSRPGRPGTPRPGAGRSSPRRAPVTRTGRGPARGWTAAALRRPGGRSGWPRAARVRAAPAAARRRPGPAGRGAPATNRSTRSARNWTLPGTGHRLESRDMTTAALAPPRSPHPDRDPPAPGDRPVRAALRCRLPGDVQLLPAPVGSPAVRRGTGRRRRRSRADHRRADVHRGVHRARDAPARAAASTTGGCSPSDWSCSAPHRCCCRSPAGWPRSWRSA